METRGCYKEFNVKSDLDKHIACVWKESYSTFFENKLKEFLVVPDNTVELVFTSNKITRNINEEPNKSSTVSTHLCGLKDTPQKVRLNGDVLLSVRFKPHGLYRFTSIDLNKTINESISPEEIFGNEIKLLEEKLFCSKSDQEQLALIESFFINRMLKVNIDQDKIFDAIIMEILVSKGDVNILELAKKYNVSKKTLERKFLSKLGIGPKKYSRIVRIFNALKIPKSDDNFMSIALSNSFYDQAHFIKEVKQFTGMTPKDYFGIDRTIQTNIFLS